MSGPPLSFQRTALLFLFGFALAKAPAVPVISEIMFHPPGAVENTAEEWLEIYNNSSDPLPLGGWKLTRGVEFTLPPGVVVGPKAALIVAADPEVFLANHPGHAGVVTGGWTGRLSNGGERIRLEDPDGNTVDEVRYADSGDWAVRARGALDAYGHRGWVWHSPADGGGHTLERARPGLRGDIGQNWTFSAAPGGTPGFVPDRGEFLGVANARHAPAIPRPGDGITVKANVFTTRPPGSPAPVVTLCWRVDGAGDFERLPMTEEFSSRESGGGDFWTELVMTATIPPRADKTVIEYYVEAREEGKTVTGPAPARLTGPEATIHQYGQVANALAQVDSSHDPAAAAAPDARPQYRLVMTAAEREELQTIHTRSRDSQSEATMNATFISADAGGVEVRQIVDVRNRGFSSRAEPPNNFYVGFRSDEPWRGREAFQLNFKYSYSQVLGANVFALGGVAEQSARPVRLFVNGADRAVSGNIMHGHYARVEPMNKEWLERHYPDDPDGNLYRLDDHSPNRPGVIPGDLGSGEFEYEGTNWLAYADTYEKRTNRELNDWTDIFEFCRVVSAPATGGTAEQPAIPDEEYPDRIKQVLDYDQWLTFFAMDALAGNQEGGLQSGRADDFGMYRGMKDTRFKLIPHDLDSVFGLGLAGASGNPVTRSIFSYDNPGGGTVRGLRRFFRHPDIVADYYAKVLELLDQVFTREKLDPLIDELLGGWVPPATIDSAKTYVDRRRANVLGQIPRVYSFTADLGSGASGYLETPDGGALLRGTFHVAEARSVLVNGRPAELFLRNLDNAQPGSWRLRVAPEDGLIQPGLNRLKAVFYPKRNGGGEPVKELTLDVYRPFPGGGTTVAGTLTADAPAVALATPDRFDPALPVPVRVDLKTPDGGFDRSVWDAEATLDAGPDATLSPATVRLYNGSGSALVSVTAAPGRTLPETLRLTARVNGAVSPPRQLARVSLAPAQTYSGELPPGTTVWSGSVRLENNVIVPDGAVLEISAGTHVFPRGTPAAGDTNGVSLIVRGGTLRINGTPEAPVVFHPLESRGFWGQIHFDQARPSTLRHAFITGGGHASGRGHTNKGPMLRLSNSSVTLEDCALSDGPAKAVYSSGECALTIRRTLMARMITGPEVTDGCALLVEDSNIQQMLPDFRESNDPEPDDEDCLYIHNGSGKSAVVRRTVLAKCGDDVLDCLGGPIVVENCVLRDGWDKGVSLLDNDLTLSLSLVVNCDKGVALKGRSARTCTVRLDRVTIVGEDHDTTRGPWGYGIPPDDPDPDTPSAGIYTQNKANQSHPGATLNVFAENCVVAAKEPVRVDAPYPAANTAVNWSLIQDVDTPGAGWPGTGNATGDPRFVNAAAGNFAPRADSPARDAGNPASAPDPDGSRADMGAVPFLNSAAVARWTRAGSPYRVTENVTVPAGLSLVIDPGVNVFFEGGRGLTVRGRLVARGTPAERITFSSVPGAVAAGDADPVKNGTQSGPPKWSGIRIYDSLDEENVVAYADFIDAQGASPGPEDNLGSVGFIRSWGRVEHCSWRGSNLRLCYGRNAKLTIQDNVFPDPFAFDPALGRVELPSDFPASANNAREALKVEYPDVPGNPRFVNGRPKNGWLRVYRNQFHGVRGHNDAMDVESGAWNAPGDFILDCRYNVFHGPGGDAHVNLDGDAYIAGNVFGPVTKDEWSSGDGPAAAVSAGRSTPNTTVTLARNVFYNVDHALNLKNGAAAFFEHNTAAEINADYVHSGSTGGAPFAREVECAPLNFFDPDDPAAPAPGRGAWMGYNLFSRLPRLASRADTAAAGAPFTTRLEFHRNLLHEIGDEELGPRHPGGVFHPAYGTNAAGAPGFADAARRDFSLDALSPARGAADGLDCGATVAEWAYVLKRGDGPGFLVGGPGLTHFKWRLDGGPWSDPAPIGAGGVFPQNDATPVRRAEVLTLTNLSPGPHRLEVLGRDMAGNWQGEDPAWPAERQAGPTVYEWIENPAGASVRINEILAASETGEPDAVELYNPLSVPVDLSGWELSDDSRPGNGHRFAPGTVVNAGGYLTLTSDLTGLALARKGDRVTLFDAAGNARDSVEFGAQVPGLTLSRVASGWTLGLPSWNAPNVPAPLGDPRDVRISEWFAAGAVLYDNDWVELANPGPYPVHAGGLRLTDNAARTTLPVAFTIPPLTFIPAEGFLVLTADGDPGDGPDHVDFSLNAEQGALALYAGDRRLDLVLMGTQARDRSQTRDGADRKVSLELPTPGFAMDPADPDYVNALNLLRGLRITEIMYNPLGGNDYEYVELRNAGSETLELEGVRFTAGITFTFPALTLPPGAETVVVANEAAFQSRYGNGPLVAGVFTGRLDNSGERLALTLPPPFTANILDFRYETAWRPETAGSGRSLELLADTTPAANFGEREAWTASVKPLGSPGENEPPPPPVSYAQWTISRGLSGDPMDDRDRDGLPDFLEFALGTDPLDGGPGQGPDALPQPAESAVPGVPLEYVFTLPRSTLPGGFGMLAVTYVLQDSADGLAWRSVARKTPASAGWEPLTAPATIVRTLSPPPGGGQTERVAFSAQPPADLLLPRRFYRLRCELSP